MSRILEELPTFRADNTTIQSTVINTAEGNMYTKIWNHKLYYEIVNN